ncbi:MAG: PQQ-binding-like beta-propeller repeat protein [Alphaproteobacteria bacterium]
MRSRYACVPALLIVLAPAEAAEVTPDRLAHADREAHNWLMNHRTYDSHRYSPLDRINRSNIGQLRLAYALPLGNGTPGENLQATPLAEDGFLYVVEQSGVLSKIDARTPDQGRIVWRVDPGQEHPPLSNRGAALWGNFVVTVANYPPRVIAIDKETGKPVWSADLSDGQPDLQLTAAPLAIKDKIIVGAAGGDLGTRDFIAALDGATGTLLWRRYVIPAPGEPGSETWKDQNNAWETGGGSMWVTGSYDVASNQVIWGTGNPVPGFDANYRPGDNLFTSSAISWNPDSGAMNWYFQYTPGGMWDYDATGPHILVDSEASEHSRTLVVHAGRNGFLYGLERDSGRVVFAKPHMEVTWTSGIDPHTGRPLDYNPDDDVQAYAGVLKSTGWGRGKAQRLCPSTYGGANFWPPSYSERTRLLYIPVLTGCVELTTFPFEREKKNWRGGNAELLGRMEGSLTIADPFTGEIKARRQMRYPIYSGALSTGGGLVFFGLLDGTFAALDDTTFEQLWSINVGIGFAAPPITFEAEGRQYIAILSGMSPIARTLLVRTPELHDQPNPTMLFVFGL